MYVKFENGVQFPLTKYPTASSAVIAGHKRDVLSVTVEGEYADIKAAFGQPWEIHVTENDTNAFGRPAQTENVYDKSNYTLVASICDNMDGTITVRVGRENTVEETLQDANSALAQENVRLAEKSMEQAEIINILAGGAV